MSNANTERAEYLFKVSEYGDGNAFVTTEPRSGPLSVLGKGGFISFDLKHPESYEHATEVAEFMNKHVRSIACTLFGA